MPRDIPVGNGKLLLCFDKDYRVRDLYFPHVGQENHLEGDSFRFGFWAENRFSWVGPEWKMDKLYMEDSLVSQVSLYHSGLALLVVCRDAVDFHENIYLREIAVENMRPEAREIRMFFAQSLNISGNSVGDTAAFDPKTGGVVHYKGKRYFLVSGRTEDHDGLDQFAVGHKNSKGKQGTFMDAEDGHLSGNSIAQGSVDSVFGLRMNVDGLARKKGFFWLAAGENWPDVRLLDSIVRKKGPESLLQRTDDYWRLWVNKETPPLELFPDKVGVLYRRSLLVLRTQIDWQGGIVAANDSDVIQFNRDTYSYIWPRDGALVANAMDLAGYPIPAQNFYQFAARVIEREGYFLHKYNPDGTLASSWHPWLSNGMEQLPIQEDETALVLWALWNHFVRYRDIEFIKPLYLPLVKSAADFMCQYRDPVTGLPKPSYDLWEERHGVFSFTVGTVFGGLTAASLFCTVFGEEERAARYQQVASEIRDAASRYLWQDDLQRFCRMLYTDDQGELAVDPSCDASLWGLFAFGLYSVDDPRIVSTMEALKEKLWLRTEVGGMARYEGDIYHQASKEFPGNPWFICTLWLADYLTDKAADENELAEALQLLQWVADHALPSGVLAEQVHPTTGEPLSVSPLTWSHATYVASCQRFIQKMIRMKTCPTCGLSALAPGREEDWIEKLYSQACDTIRGICKVR